MKNLIFECRIFVVIFLFSNVTACKSQNNHNSIINEQHATGTQSQKDSSQIGEYVTSIFEDKKGNLWFSTLSEGIAKYDGKNLIYYTEIGLRVGAIVEDTSENLWFGTHNGVYKYDGKTFTNYSVNDGLCDNLVSNILIDKKGTIWVGTWGGVCKFNGNEFINFPIPKPDVDLFSYQTTMNWSTEIMEDSKGNIWFGRDGYGATKYDGKSFTHFTKKNGLASNNICDIQEDKFGEIWFSSRITEKDNPNINERLGDGGLVKYNGKEFVKFPNLPGLHNSDVHQIYRDSKDNIWIGTTNNGLYKYDGHDFTNYKGEGNIFPKPVMGILEDRRGRLWIGCAGGLFRLDSGTIKNVTVSGPWN